MIKPAKAPFADTTVPADKSRAKIDSLLQEYGVEAVRWERMGDSMTLSIGVETEIDGNPRKLVLKFTPPPCYTERKLWDENTGKAVKQKAVNMAQSMRVLYHYLKIKLAIVAWGVKKFEEEFLAEIIVETPQGPARLIDALKARAPELLGLPDRSQDSEPETTTSRGKVIDITPN
jgi:viroplasmin and RNaseH domain-containing protein